MGKGKFQRLVNVVLPEYAGPHKKLTEADGILAFLYQWFK